jgi:hypothetical protein
MAILERAAANFPTFSWQIVATRLHSEQYCPVAAPIWHCLITLRPRMDEPSSRPLQPASSKNGCKQFYAAIPHDHAESAPQKSVRATLRANQVREPGRRCACAGDHTCTLTWTAAQRTGLRGPTIYPPCCSRPHLRRPPASDHPGTLTAPRPTMFRRGRAQPRRTGARTSPSKLPSLTAPPNRPGKTYAPRSFRQETCPNAQNSHRTSRLVSWGRENPLCPLDAHDSLTTPCASGLGVDDQIRLTGKLQVWQFLFLQSCRVQTSVAHEPGIRHFTPGSDGITAAAVEVCTWLSSGW